MSAPGLVRDDIQSAPEPSPPKPVLNVALIALLLAIIGVLMMVWAAVLLRDFNDGGTIATIIGIILVVLALYPFWPTLHGFSHARKRSALLAKGQLVAARRTAASGREDTMVGMGYAVAVMIVAGLLILALINKGVFAATFFSGHSWHLSFSQMIRAFWTNVWVACVAQVLVLIFGLLLAVMRMLPGRAGGPLRLIATVYCDIFRAIPALVTVLLVVFGLPLVFTTTTRWNPAFLGVVALTLTYSAYVAEVYRAGLASIHPSQGAAARSLGLSYGQTLRAVLVPQAVRRMIPPLLNDFISLQKDTSLLSAAGISEVVLVGKFWESKLFDLAPVTLAAAFFIIITIPQARFVDYLINRDAARRAGG